MINFPVVCLESLSFTVSVLVFSLTDEHQHDHDIPAPTPPPRNCDSSISSLSTSVHPPHRQLLHIPLGSSLAENTLLVCLFSARSVGTSRRRSDISTFILHNNIGIMLLLETWLHPAGDKAKTTHLAPPGYSVLSFPCSLDGPGTKSSGVASPSS